MTELPDKRWRDLVDRGIVSVDDDCPCPLTARNDADLCYWCARENAGRDLANNSGKNLPPREDT